MESSPYANNCLIFINLEGVNLNECSYISYIRVLKQIALLVYNTIKKNYL